MKKNVEKVFGNMTYSFIRDNIYIHLVKLTYIQLPDSFQHPLLK